MFKANDLQSDQEPIISLKGITKSFPSVIANDHIDLDIYAGEVHALLGENGAGKSVLMKILYGFYRADAGTILLKGKPVSIQSPAMARNVHIGMVFQDLNLIPVFSVAENIALFLPDLKAVLHPKEIVRHIEKISGRYNLKVDPQALVSEISIGEQQKAEILKLLLSDARVLILDEPTGVLAPHEVEALFGVLDNLRKDGYAIILITHKMKEVLQCADRITVLRRGRVAGTMLRAEASEDKLVNLMFEKTLTGVNINPKDGFDKSLGPLLELRDIETRGRRTGSRLIGINLKIYPGEIVGVAGGGGIPVIRNPDKSLRGVEAVIDKDLASARLAIDIEADILLILTFVENAFIDFGWSSQKPLHFITVAESEELLKEGQFGVGSMEPKIRASINFINGATRKSGREVIITTPETVMKALNGDAGTHITLS